VVNYSRFKVGLCVEAGQLTQALALKIKETCSPCSPKRCTRLPESTTKMPQPWLPVDDRVRVLLKHPAGQPRLECWHVLGLRCDVILSSLWELVSLSATSLRAEPNEKNVAGSYACAAPPRFRASDPMIPHLSRARARRWPLFAG
jgi:hypothetical protein